jgi:hypothetical protein
MWKLRGRTKKRLNQKYILINKLHDENEELKGSIAQLKSQD